MIQNVGSIDWAMRVMLAIVLLVTARIRICPIYSIFGFKTCRS